MTFQGEVIVKAPIEKVWDFLLDLNRSVKCIPGCMEMKPIDDRHCQAKIKSATSLITAKFNSLISIIGVDPLNSVYVEVNGEDKSMGSGFYAKGEVKLFATSEGKTEASYLLDVSIHGRLASFGDRVARIKLNEMVKKFASNLAKAIIK